MNKNSKRTLSDSLYKHILDHPSEFEVLSKKRGTINQYKRIAPPNNDT